MTKYFITEITHPQTTKKVTVYCKAVLNEESLAKVFVVYPEEKPFVLVTSMSVKTIEQEDSITHNMYSQNLSFLQNLFG